MVVFISWLLGLVFGLGLILSGMSDPAKVLGFLDVAGLWDPSLGFVMAGAIGVAFFPFQRSRKRDKSLLGVALSKSDNTNVDMPLLLGSGLFGIGWGLSGFCPGPALVGLGTGYLAAAAFVVAMIFGMEIHNWLLEAEIRRK